MRSLIFIICIAFASCVSELDLDFPAGKTQLAGFGMLSAENEHQKFQLSFTVPFKDTITDNRVSGADVKVRSSKDEVFVFDECDSIPGTYYSRQKFAGEIGVDYTVVVDIDFNKDGVQEQYTASSTMFAPPEITSIGVSVAKKIGYTVYIPKFNGPAPAKNIDWLLSYYCNGVSIGNRFMYMNTVDVERFSGNLPMIDLPLVNANIRTMFMDESSRNNFDADDEDHNVFVKSGDEITVRFHPITKDFSTFVKACKSATQPSNPIFGSVAYSVPTNFSSGMIGFFAALSSSEFQFTIP